MIRRFRSLSHRGRAVAAVAALAILLVVATAMAAVLAGFASRDALTDFPAEGLRRPVTALYFSGDMGLRFGMGPYTSRTLAENGIPVLGVASSTLFATHRTAAQTDAIVADTVRQALARTRADRLVLIGQSFGADILQTGLAHLPRPLRGRIASVILVVPGESVFFRADPLGFAYRGTPDSLARATIPAIDWAPLTCIYGALETDSACPAVHGPDATVVRMPGGHFLANDRQGLVARVLSTIRRDVPQAFARDR